MPEIQARALLARDFLVLLFGGHARRSRLDSAQIRIKPQQVF
jgi:hypothetical protein